MQESIAPTGWDAFPAVATPEPSGFASLGIKPPEPEKDFWDTVDVISGIWDAVKGLGVTAPAAFYQLTEGLERPDKYSDSAKRAFAEADAYALEMKAKTEANRKAGTSSSVGESMRETGQSLGFTLGSLGTAVAAGAANAAAWAAVGAGGGAAVGSAAGGVGAAPGAAAGGVAGGTAGFVTGAAATMLASGTAAYRMAGASFLNEAFQNMEREAIATRGRPMTEQEKVDAYEVLLPIAKNTAWWEAGPEAIGNAITLGAGKLIFGKGIVKTLEGLGMKKLAPLAATKPGRLAIKVGAGAASVGTELATETLTQVEQAADQLKANAIAQGKDPSSISADWSPSGVASAFREVMPQTLALLGLMGGAGAAVKTTAQVADTALRKAGLLQTADASLDIATPDPGEFPVEAPLPDPVTPSIQQQAPEPIEQPAALEEVASTSPETPAASPAAVASKASFDAAFPQRDVVMDEDHVYTVGGKTLPSVTTLKDAHELFKFNPAARSIVAKKLGIPEKDVQAMWDAKTESGNAMHERMALALNNPEAKMNDGLRDIVAKVREGAVDDVVSERAVWTDSYAGTIDALTPLADGTWRLTDFKEQDPHDSDRNAVNPKYSNSWQGKPTKVDGYKLQLAAYKHALEKKGIIVSETMVIPVNRKSGRPFRNADGSVLTIDATADERTNQLFDEIFASLTPTPNTNESQVEGQGQGRQEVLTPAAEPEGVASPGVPLSIPASSYEAGDKIDINGLVYSKTGPNSWRVGSDIVDDSLIDRLSKQSTPVASTQPSAEEALAPPIPKTPEAPNIPPSASSAGAAIPFKPDWHPDAVKSSSGRSGILKRIASFFDMSPKAASREAAQRIMDEYGAMGHASGWLNEQKIREDYRNGMKYIRGETPNSAGSRQKKALWDRMGISADEFQRFIEQHGGEQAYVDFIKAHEVGHVESGHRERKPVSKDLMSDELLSREVEANEWALRAIGFYEWRAEQSPSAEKALAPQTPKTTESPEAPKATPANPREQRLAVAARATESSSMPEIEKRFAATSNPAVRSFADAREIVREAAGGNRMREARAALDALGSSPETKAEVQQAIDGMRDHGIEGAPGKAFSEVLSRLSAAYGTGDTLASSPQPVSAPAAGMGHLHVTKETFEENTSKADKQGRRATVGLALKVGQLVTVGEKNKVSSAHVVVAASKAPDGRTKHHLVPVSIGTLKQSSPVMEKQIARFQPNRDVIRNAVTLVRETARIVATGRGKAERHIVAGNVRKAIHAQFRSILGPEMADEVVFDYNPDSQSSPMFYDWAGDGKIHVNAAHYTDELSRRVALVNSANEAAIEGVARDFAEEVAQTALEESAHQHSTGVFDVAEASSIAQDLFDLNTNAARSELARAIRWRPGFAGVSEESALAAFQTMSDTEKASVFHELLASLYARSRTGTDTLSARQRAQRYLDHLVKDAPAAQQTTLIGRLIEMANRYFEAMRDFLKAQKTVAALPSRIGEWMRMLDETFEKDGVFLPDTFDVATSSARQLSAEIATMERLSRDQPKLASAQKALRDEMEKLRGVYGPGFLPVSLSMDGELIPDPSLEFSEADALQPILDELNTAARAEQTVHFMGVARDLEMVLRHLNSGVRPTRVVKYYPPNSRRQISGNYTDPNGNLINGELAVASDVLPMMIDALREVERTFGMSAPEFIKKLDAAMQALAQKPFSTDEHRRLQDGLLNIVATLGGNKATKALVGRQKAINEQLAAGGLDPDANEALLNELNDVSRLIEEELTRISLATDSKGKPTAAAREVLRDRPKRDKLFREALDEARRRQEAFSQITSSGALLNRYIHHPNEVIEALRDAMPNPIPTIEALQRAADLGAAARRLATFREEFDFLVLGGKPPGRRSRKWTGVNVGQISDISLMPISTGRLAFAFGAGMMETATDRLLETPQAFAGSLGALSTFGTITLRYDASDAHRIEDEPYEEKDGVITFTNPDTAQQVVRVLASEVEEGSKAASRMLGVQPLIKPETEEGIPFTSYERMDPMLSNARVFNEEAVAALQEARWRNHRAVSEEAMLTNGFSIGYSRDRDGELRIIRPQEIISMPDLGDGRLDAEGGWDDKFWHLIDSGVVGELLAGNFEFARNHGEVMAGRTAPLLSHEHGLTPAGLAWQMTQPKLIELLALTKGLMMARGENQLVDVQQALLDSVTLTAAEEDALDAHRPESAITPEIARIQRKLETHAMLLRAYASLAPGMEREIQKGKSLKPFDLGNYIWDLYRNSKVANQVYRDSFYISNQRSRLDALEDAVRDIPINVDSMRDAAFEASLRSKIARLTDDGAFISLLLPKPALSYMREWARLSNMAPEEVLVEDGDGFKLVPFGADKDGDQAMDADDMVYGQAEAILRGRERIARMMDIWRGNTLLAIMGGDADRVLDVVNSKEFSSIENGPDGEPRLVYHADALNAFILDELEKFHAEEKRRGAILDGTGGSRATFDASIRGLGERNKDFAQVVDSLLETGGVVEMMHQTAPRLDPAPFVADYHSLTTAIGAMIPSLAIIHGNASWELSQDFASAPLAGSKDIGLWRSRIDAIRETLSAMAKDDSKTRKSTAHVERRVALTKELQGLEAESLNIFGESARAELSLPETALPGKRIPTIAFIPDAQAPSLVMPYAPNVTITEQDAREALVSMLEWLGRNGGANLVEQAQRLVDVLRNNQSSHQALVENIRSRYEDVLRANGETWGEKEDAYVDALARQWGRVVENGVRKSAGLINDAADGWFSGINDGPVPDNANAARIIALALADPNARKALVLAMRSAPDVGAAPTPEQLALRGDLIDRNRLPGFFEATIADQIADLRNTFVPKDGNGVELDVDDEGFAEAAEAEAEKAMEETARGIPESVDGDSASDRLSAMAASPVAMQQAEWAGELLHSVLDHLTPSFGQDVEDAPWNYTESSKRKPSKPRGLLPDTIPDDQRLSSFEARQLLAVADGSILNTIVSGSRSRIAWNGGASAPAPSVDELMAATGAAAEHLRSVARVALTQVKGDHSEDQNFNFKTFSFTDALDWQGYRPSIWHKSRVKKGMIGNAELLAQQGAGMVLPIHENATPEQHRVHLQTSFDQLLRAAMDAGILKYVPDPDDASAPHIDELTLARRTYEREVAAHKEWREAMKRDLLVEIGEKQDLENALSELDALERELVGKPELSEYLKTLRGSEHISIKQFGPLVRKVFGSHEALLHAMSSEIVGNYMDGAADYWRSLSIRRAVEPARALPSSGTAEAPNTPFSAFFANLEQQAKENNQTLLERAEALRNVILKERADYAASVDLETVDADVFNPRIAEFNARLAQLAEAIARHKAGDTASFLRQRKADVAAREYRPETRSFSTTGIELWGMANKHLERLRPIISQLETLPATIADLESQRENAINFGLGSNIEEIERLNVRIGIASDNLSAARAAFQSNVAQAESYANRRVPSIVRGGEFGLEDTSSPARFQRLLRDLTTRDGLFKRVHQAMAHEAVLAAEHFDPSELPSLDLSGLSRDRRIEIPREARDGIIRALEQGGTIEQMMARVEEELGKSVLPKEQAAIAATAQLKRAMARKLSTPRSRNAGMVMEVFAIADELESFANIDALTQRSIVMNVTRELLNDRRTWNESGVRRRLNALAKEEASYERRVTKFWSHREGKPSGLVLLGTPDENAVAGRWLGQLGERWSERYMSLREDSRMVDGYERALEAASLTDAELAEMGSEVMEIATGESWKVVDGVVMPVLGAEFMSEKAEREKMDAWARRKAGGRYKSWEHMKQVREAARKTQQKEISRISGRAGVDDMIPGAPFAITFPKGGELGTDNPLNAPFVVERTNRIMSRIEEMGWFGRQDPASLRRQKAQAASLYNAGLDQLLMVKEQTRARIAQMVAAVENGSIRGVKGFVDSASIREDLSLHDEVAGLLRILETQPSEITMREIHPLSNNVAAVLMSRDKLQDLMDGFIPGEVFSDKMIKVLLNHDPLVRSMFARTLRGQEAAFGILGVLDHGVTGIGGRNGFTAANDAYARLLDEESKKLKELKDLRGDEARNSGGAYYDAAIGRMYQAVRGYLLSSGESISDRAEAVLRGFGQADEGYLEANRTTGLLDKWKKHFLGTTYKAVEQQKVYERIRDGFAPILRQIADGAIEPEMGIQAMEALLSPQARRWGSFLHDTMSHLKDAFVAQARMSGIDPSIIANHAPVGFHWQVFNREYSPSEQEPSLSELTDMGRASFLSRPTRNPKPGEIHLLDIDGIIGAQSQIRDMLFRMNIQPAYATFKKIVGTSEHVGRTLRGGEVGWMERIADQQFEGASKDALSMSRAVALAGQEIIRKDMLEQLPANRMMDIMQKFQQIGATKALVSISQMWRQTMPGMVFYSIAYGGKENFNFPKLYGRYLFDKIAGKLRLGRYGTAGTAHSLADNIDHMVERFAPNDYKRTFDGQRNFYDRLSRMRPDPSLRADGRISGKHRNLSDAASFVPREAAYWTMKTANWMLHTVLANAESTMVRSIWAHEITKLYNKSRAERGEAPLSVEEVMNPLNNHGGNFSQDMLSRASRAVTDVMAVNDSGKKGRLFEQADTVKAEVVRGMLVTFANHQMHMSGNSWAAWKMIRNGDAAAKAEGRRLIATSLGQNVMFQLFRYETMGLLLATVLAAIFDWDDEEKEDFYGSLYGINPEATEDEARAGLLRWVSLLAGGSNNPIGFRDGSWDEDEKAKDLKTLALRSTKELVTQTPFAGVGLLASTTLGSTLSEWALKNTVMELIPGELGYYERAGMVIPERWGGTGDGPQSERGWERLAYHASKMFMNDIASRSTLTGGITSLLDPIVQISNADDAVEPMDALSIWMSQFPAMPRELRQVAQKPFLDNTDARIWAGSWESR